MIDGAQMRWSRFNYPTIYALVLTVGLTACQMGMPPPISAIVASGDSSEKALSADQLQKLSRWLDKHSNDWTGCYDTPPPFSDFSLSLKHAGGKSSHLRLIALANGTTSHTLEAHYFDGSKQRCAYLKVSDQEINELHALIAP